MSKFIYKDTLQTKYNEGTILTDDVKCKTLEVNKITSDNPYINIDKDINIDGDLSISGDINIEDVDINTIKTNTITSDNNSININKSINTNEINNTGTITSSSDISSSNIKLDNTNKKVKVNNNNVWDNYICDGQGTLIGKNGTGTNGEIFNDYSNNTASGNYSHAEGTSTTASGNHSHAEGGQTTASGTRSHAEGASTNASGTYSHAECRETKAYGNNTHAEGWNGIAIGENTHAEGYKSRAVGTDSHSEGKETVAGGYKYTATSTTISDFIAGTGHSHAEGWSTIAYGAASHTEGRGTKTCTISGSGTSESPYSYSGGNYAHAEGNNTTASGEASHAEGGATTASGKYSHAAGNNTIASQPNETVVGSYNVSDSGTTGKLFVVGNGTANNNRSDALVVYDNGQVNVQNAISIGKNLYGITNSTAYGCVNFGNWSTSSNQTDKVLNIGIGYDNSHRKDGLFFRNIHSGSGFGDSSNYGLLECSDEIKSKLITAQTGNNGIRLNSSTQTIQTTTDGTNWSNVSLGSTVGQNYYVSGNLKGEIFNAYSINVASGVSSHAEGYNTTASNDNAHAEGYCSTASGDNSHAEGYDTEASGSCSHAGGFETIASQEDETVIGRFNIDETGQTTHKLFVIGNGTANNNRSDAFTVDNDANVIIRKGNNIIKIIPNDLQIKSSSDGGITWHITQLGI